MRDDGGAQRRIPQSAGEEVGENFQELAGIFQSALERVADVPDSTPIRERLERAKASAERGASIAEKFQTK